MSLYCPPGGASNIVALVWSSSSSSLQSNRMYYVDVVRVVALLAMILKKVATISSCRVDGSGEGVCDIAIAAKARVAAKREIASESWTGNVECGMRRLNWSYLDVLAVVNTTSRLISFQSKNKNTVALPSFPNFLSVLVSDSYVVWIVVCLPNPSQVKSDSYTAQSPTSAREAVAFQYILLPPRH
ncbi:hypothetical protein FA15DRAFT_660203 [Coprinopsis marcescibilis]|uniref:Uncharacterized protein n=1 Tax=Coprinopsis marcescibilis TaxID=230819 RepID=A0A5C3KG54_COPMA|nr:hypothetical protein FA15DRAFT_660203 [Coprinopsis marcescibilis]